MNKIKVFWNGKRLRDLYPHASWYQVIMWKMYRISRKVVIVSFIGGMVFGAFKLGTLTPGEITYAVTPEIVIVPKTPPVLERIAECESNNMHYGKDGQVIMRGNTNGSIDVGRYQINSVWNAKATELGLDITKEADNKKMAEWIYENRGTEDWYPSKKCWQR